MYSDTSKRTSVLTLNQDKRRRFDSCPGSIGAGQALMALADRWSQDGDFAPRYALTSPAVAAFSATRAAMDARELGQSPEQAARAYADAYAEMARG
jgi:hypothetical protein